MKAPVGLLSDGTVCVSRWRGFAPTSSMQASVEDEIRNHRLTDISHNMISGGQDLDGNHFNLLLEIVTDS